MGSRELDDVNGRKGVKNRASKGTINVWTMVVHQILRDVQ